MGGSTLTCFYSKAAGMEANIYEFHGNIIIILHKNSLKKYNKIFHSSCNDTT
jgi:hypothetical protein